MVDMKETFYINLGSKGNKKVKGYPYYSSKLKRKLFIHTNIDNEKYTSVSDTVTGYRLFGFPEKPDKIKIEQVEEKLEEFIKHYSIPLIHEEFQRVEKLLAEEVKK